MGRPVIWQYWEKPAGQEGVPEYISMCFDTVEKKCGDCFEIVRLSQESLKEYLPKRLVSYLSRVSVGPKMRRGIPSQIGVKAGCLRLLLLDLHGGIWIDADCIVLRSLERVWQLAEGGSQFFAGQITSRPGFYRISNGLMGSRAGMPIIGELAKAVRERLMVSTKLRWGEVGWALITPLIIQKQIRKQEHQYMIFSEKTFHPVMSRHRASFFMRDPVHRWVTEDTRTAMLYSSSMSEWLIGKSRNELLDGKRLITKLYRIGMGIDDYAFVTA